MSVDLSSPGFYVSVLAAGSSTEERAPEGRVISLSFEDDEKKPDKLTLSIDNYDLTQFESPLWQPTNVVIFQYGYPGAMSPPRRMKIQKVKGFNPLTVEALGDEAEMNKIRGDGTERWTQKKRSEIVREIAAKYGFKPEQMHITDTEIILPQVTKGVMTDLQLLRSLAEREQFEFYVDHDGIHFHPQNSGQAPLRKITYFTDGTGIIEGYPTLDDDRAPGKPGGFVLKGRNQMTKESFTVRGDDSTSSSRTALAPERTAFTGYDDSAPPAGAQLWTAPTTELTKESAERLARGAYTRQQLKSVGLTLPCRGDASVAAKSVLEIDGLRATLSGLYYVTNAKHDLGAGYKMTLKVRRDGRGAGGAGGGKKTTAPTEARKNAESAPAAEAPVPMKEVRVFDPSTGQFTGTRLVPGGRDSGT